MILFILGFIIGQIVMGLLMLYGQKQNHKKLMSNLQLLKAELEY